jgi:hypothetical protein
MLDKIIATFCILDDLLHILHHRNDPQAKITDRESLTIAILCSQVARTTRPARATLLPSLGRLP